MLYELVVLLVHIYSKKEKPALILKSMGNAIETWWINFSCLHWRMLIRTTFGSQKTAPSDHHEHLALSPRSCSSTQLHIFWGFMGSRLPKQINPMRLTIDALEESIRCYWRHTLSIAARSGQKAESLSWNSCGHLAVSIFIYLFFYLLLFSEY